MDNLIKKSAHAFAIAIDLKKYKEKAISLEFVPRMLSVATILCGIFFTLIYRTHFLESMQILMVLNVIDLFALFLKKESKTKIYADRLTEAIMFSTMAIQWQCLVAINFVLALMRVKTFKKLPIMPLKLIFLIYTLFIAF